MGVIINSPRKSYLLTYNHVIYLCVFLSCLVPRYIATFKLHLGINISFYTIAVFVFWGLTVHNITVKNRIEFLVFFIWAAFILFSIWRAEKLGVWAYYVDWILTAILFQQILIRHQGKDTYRFIIYAMTDAVFIHLLIGLYEVTAHTYLFETGNVSRRLYGHVAISIFHNLNDYATFVTTMIPLVFYRFISSSKFMVRLYCGFLVAASMYLIITSESRGAALTVIALVLGAVIVFARKSLNNTFIALAGSFAFLYAAAANFWGLRRILFNSLSNYTIDFTGRSDAVRINLIKNGLFFLKQTYGFGVGAGNLYDWLTDKAIYPIGGLRFIHNWYVEVLVTFGIVFFVLYMIFHIKVIVNLWSRKYADNQMKTALFLSFVCFSIVSISSSSNVYSEWVWMYLVAVSVFSATLQNEGPGAKKSLNG